jgi:hypothetical protein
MVPFVAPTATNKDVPTFAQIANDLGWHIADMQLSMATDLARLALGLALYRPLSDRYCCKPVITLAC